MMEKAFSIMILCILLIPVLLLPSTAAGRALVRTTNTDGGNHGRSKIGVTGHESPTAPSKTGSSPPSEPTPSRRSYITIRALNRSNAATSCGSGKRYGSCLPQRPTRPPPQCTSYKRSCK